MNYVESLDILATTCHSMVFREEFLPKAYAKLGLKKSPPSYSIDKLKSLMKMFRKYADMDKDIKSKLSTKEVELFYERMWIFIKMELKEMLMYLMNYYRSNDLYKGNLLQEYVKFLLINLYLMEIIGVLKVFLKADDLIFIRDVKVYPPKFRSLEHYLANNYVGLMECVKMFDRSIEDRRVRLVEEILSDYHRIAANYDVLIEQKGDKAIDEQIAGLNDKVLHFNLRIDPTFPELKLANQIYPPDPEIKNFFKAQSQLSLFDHSTTNKLLNAFLEILMIYPRRLKGSSRYKLEELFSKYLQTGQIKDWLQFSITYGYFFDKLFAEYPEVNFINMLKKLVSSIFSLWEVTILVNPIIKEKQELRLIELLGTFYRILLILDMVFNCQSYATFGGPNQKGALKFQSLDCILPWLEDKQEYDNTYFMNLFNGDGGIVDINQIHKKIESTTFTWEKTYKWYFYKSHFS